MQAQNDRRLRWPVLVDSDANAASDDVSVGSLHAGRACHSMGRLVWTRGSGQLGRSTDLVPPPAAEAPSSDPIISQWTIIYLHGCSIRSDDKCPILTRLMRPWSFVSAIPNFRDQFTSTLLLSGIYSLAFLDDQPTCNARYEQRDTCSGVLGCGTAAYRTLACGRPDFDGDPTDLRGHGGTLE